MDPVLGVGIGAEPQQAGVTVYHAARLLPAPKMGEKEDLYIKDNRVVITGLKEGDAEELKLKDNKPEFDFDETLGAGTPPEQVAQSVLPPLAKAAVRGLNGLLVVLGEVVSELMPDDERELLGVALHQLDQTAMHEDVPWQLVGDKGVDGLVVDDHKPPRASHRRLLRGQLP